MSSENIENSIYCRYGDDVCGDPAGISDIERADADRVREGSRVKQSQVSEWLRGKASPGYEALRRMSLAYGVSADYFLGLREDF